MDVKMEIDGYNTDSSNDEMAEYVLSAWDGTGMLQEGTQPAERSVQDLYTEEISKRAAQFLEDGVTFTDYETFIKEKPIGCERISMSPIVAGLIGQATMNFVKGNHEETLRLCKEVIRQSPYTSEAYKTLSEMYEECDDREKSLRLGMIAAALKGDAGEWMALGQKADELQKFKEAAYCFTEAVKKDPTAYDAHCMRIKLFSLLNEHKNLLAAHQKLVEGVSPEIGDPILKMARAGAQLFHADNDVKGALSVMETAFRKVPMLVTSDDINLILELYLTLNKYEECLEIISKHCGVEIEAEEAIERDQETDEVAASVFRVINYKINSEIPHQLRSKLAIVLVHLKALDLVDGVIAPLLEDVEENGDLILDVVEALMQTSVYLEALKLLRILINDDNMRTAAQVWLHYAECLRQMGRKEEAVSAYLEVMERAPHQTDARFVVSDLLNELGRSDEALNALTQDPEAGSLDVGMLFERCLLLKGNPQRVAEFLAVGRLLLSRHCARIRTRKDLALFTRFSGTHRRIEVKRLAGEEMKADQPQYVEGRRMPTIDDEWRLFLGLCQAAYDTKQYALLQRLSFSALGSDYLCRNPGQESKTKIIATLACLYNKDSHHGYNLIRQLVLSGFDNPRGWSIYNLIIGQTEEIRHQKFVIRLLARKPSHPVLPTLFANNCFLNGSYKQAVSEYLLLYKHEKSALTALMIGITFIQLASQKHASNINALVSQAMAFISDYKKLRGDYCLQEVHYNIGRLYHQLGLLPPAVYHYKTSLETPAPCEMFDLKRETAYNLATIYMNSKSYDLARFYIDKYVVI